jgi:hypothetical protein
MNARTQVLKQLVGDSQYVVDPEAVAEAIVVRLMARRVLADVSFRSSDRRPPPRESGEADSSVV